MAEEEFGAEPSLCTRCGGGLSVVGAEGGGGGGGGAWRLGGKLKKEVLEDGGDRLGGKEK